MAVYDVGDRVKIYTSTVFTDENDSPVDPTTVVFSVKDPTGTETTYTYNAVPSEGVVRDGVGDYYKLLDVESSGRWDYRIEGEDGSGNNMGADEGFFMVRESEF